MWWKLATFIILFFVESVLNSSDNKRSGVRNDSRDRLEELRNLPTAGDHKHTGVKRRLKILIDSPTIGWSHVQFQGRLADLLTDAGHEVHILMQQTNPLISNYTGTSRGQRVKRVPRPPGKEDDYLKIRHIQNPFAGPTNMLFDGSIPEFHKLHMEQCEEVITDIGLLTELENEHYDVGISEGIHLCPFAVFKRIGVGTSLATLAINLNPFFAHHFGIPTFPSWVPSFFNPSMNGSAMAFWERAISFLLQMLEQYTMRPHYFGLHDTLFKRAFGENFPSVTMLMRNVSMIFVNENEFFGMPHLVSNKVINIGGIVEKQAKELSPLATSILDGAHSGAVLFSFGTVANPSNMSEPMKRAFLSAFARFPTYEFIWKHKLHPNDSALPIPPNVHLFEWVEQKALLQHPRLRAFITHCGLNSVNEAARAGVPLVGVPLFGDQPHNAALMNVKGIGVHLDIRECYDEAPIVNALEKVLHDPSYAHNARLVSRKLRLSPFSPAERFVRWVEFAADYPELNELNLPYHEFSFLTYYCLDVVAVTLVVLMIMIALIYFVVKVLLYVLSMATSLWPDPLVDFSSPSRPKTRNKKRRNLKND